MDELGPTSNPDRYSVDQLIQDGELNDTSYVEAFEHENQGSTIFFVREEMDTEWIESGTVYYLEDER